MKQPVPTYLSEDAKGHSSHMKDATETGLPGAMRKPVKLVMLGAGSAFTPRLVADIVQIPENAGGEIAIVDTDTDRLSQMKQLLHLLLEKNGAAGQWKLGASADRRDVLAGCDYIVNCIEVSGLACVGHDYDIPLRYGVDQCIGDTIGPGGLFKALRTIPVFLEVLRDAEELCPEALVLNYTNPMSMMCLAAGRTSQMRVTGLCHSVQGTTRILADRLGIPLGEIEWECAGINHLAWITKFKKDGVDLYPRLMEMAEADLEAAANDQMPPAPATDPAQAAQLPAERPDLIRKDMLLHFGAFITESSGHLSEYLPYYRKRKDLIARYARPGMDGESGFYAHNWPKMRSNADRERAEMIAGNRELEFNRSWEYASWIIEAQQKDRPFRIHGNVMNSDGNGALLIPNLPADGCVEVACMVDQNGIHPTRHGLLPPHMAALCQANMAMFGLGAQAAIERSKELAIHALMVDPLTAAVCSPAEIKAMTLEMFEAQAEFLPGYR